MVSNLKLRSLCPQSTYESRISYQLSLPGHHPQTWVCAGKLVKFCASQDTRHARTWVWAGCAWSLNQESKRLDYAHVCIITMRAQMSNTGIAVLTVLRGQEGECVQTSDVCL